MVAAGIPCKSCRFPAESAVLRLIQSPVCSAQPGDSPYETADGPRSTPPRDSGTGRRRPTDPLPGPLFNRFLGHDAQRFFPEATQYCQGRRPDAPVICQAARDQPGSVDRNRKPRWSEKSAKTPCTRGRRNRPQCKPQGRAISNSGRRHTVTYRYWSSSRVRQPYTRKSSFCGSERYSA